MNADAGLIQWPKNKTGHIYDEAIRAFHYVLAHHTPDVFDAPLVSKNTSESFEIKQNLSNTGIVLSEPLTCIIAWWVCAMVQSWQPYFTCTYGEHQNV